MTVNNCTLSTLAYFPDAIDWPDRSYEDVREVLQTLKRADPLYLFCANALKRRVQYFQHGFPGTLSYAVKANPEERVLKTLANAGIADFDVASIKEIQTVHKIAPLARLHFNNPVKTSHTIASAYHEYGVRSFALDDLAELHKIMHATGNARDLMLSVRFKLAHHQASFDFGSKFGASFSEAVEILHAIKRLGAKAALTFHPGSQCVSPDTYRKYIKAAAKILAVAKLDIEQINVGGGFPEQYLHRDVPALQDYFLVIRTALSKYFADKAPKLMCEPGRSLVASSTSLLTQVIHVRANRSAIFLNDGVYGGLQEQSIVDLPLPLKFWRDGQQMRSRKHEVTLFGPTCDPTDRLPRPVSVPTDLLEGDYIEFGLAGAYGSATATQFNGFRSNQYVETRRCFYDL